MFTHCSDFLDTELAEVRSKTIDIYGYEKFALTDKQDLNQIKVHTDDFLMHLINDLMIPSDLLDTWTLTCSPFYFNVSLEETLQMMKSHNAVSKSKLEVAYPNQILKDCLISVSIKFDNSIVDGMLMGLGLVSNDTIICDPDQNQIQIGTMTGDIITYDMFKTKYPNNNDGTYVIKMASTGIN